MSVTSVIVTTKVSTLDNPPQITDSFTWPDTRLVTQSPTLGKNNVRISWALNPGGFDRNILASIILGKHRCSWGVEILWRWP